jgi:hypothetical protein
MRHIKDIRVLHCTLAVLVLALSACSDSAKKADDDDDSARSVCAVGAFQSCAQGVLAKSTLSPSEIESLSTCSFASAKPQTSPADVFAVAEAAVKATCAK